VLGRGKFAVVHSARDNVTGGEMAVKILSKEFSGTKRLLAEIELLFSLEHPNIVRYLRASERGNSVFIYMELCRSSVDQLPIADRKMPPLLNLDAPSDAELPRLATVVSVLQQLTSATAYLHERHVVHRDIKPGNLLVGTDGATVKLGDFGVAFAVQETGDNTEGAKKAETGVVGTLAFMAPEVLRGHAHSPKCDVYSVGMVLVSLLKWTPRSFEELVSTRGLGPSSVLGYFDAHPDFVAEIEADHFPGGVPADRASRVSNAFDFLRRSMHPDPAHRASAAELLEHPFLIAVAAVPQRLLGPGPAPSALAKPEPDSPRSDDGEPAEPVGRLWGIAASSTSTDDE
jgi:serine/threonine protein kinase